MMIYPNNLKNREFDKKAPQNSDLERATIAHEQAASEDRNFKAKPTLSKTDFSSCLGIKRYPFTLLELIIGMALAAIVVSFLFSSFRYSSIGHSKIKIAQQAVHERLCLQTRLTQVFDQFQFENKKKAIYLAAHPESYAEALYFSFHQEIDQDPHFIGVLDAVLFINFKKQLCLLTISPDGSARRDIFFDNIESLSFQFFDSQNAKWQPKWKKELPHAPTFLTLLLKEQSRKEPLDFSFVLKGKASDITYFKENK